MADQQVKTILKKSIAKGGIKLKDSDFSVGSGGKRNPQKVYKFRVDMWCEGCAMDVKQVLELAKAGNIISDYGLDYATKKVTLTSFAKLDEVYEILSRSGKHYALEETKLAEMARVRPK